MFKVNDIKEAQDFRNPPKVSRFENAKRVLLEKLEKTRAQNYSQGVRRQSCTDFTK
jgi:hypothetical protein